MAPKGIATLIPFKPVENKVVTRLQPKSERKMLSQLCLSDRYHGCSQSRWVSAWARVPLPDPLGGIPGIEDRSRGLELPLRPRPVCS